MKTEVLQICSLPALLQQGLNERFTVHRWDELADQQAWLRAHAGQIRAAITGGHAGIASSLVDALPNLGIIAISGVGYDKVDLQQAQRRGLRVTYTPGVLTDDVADLTVGLIVCLLRGVLPSHQYLLDGRWPAGNYPLMHKVSGRRFGIIGLGRIGTAIGARLSCMGPVAYTSPHEKVTSYRYFPDAVSLAAASDVLVVASIANAATRGLVSEQVLEALGPQGYLVNVARGSVVDEPALIRALTEKRIAGAALDVFVDEPNVPAALCALPNVILTPHIGTATHETRESMGRLVLENLDAYFAGQPLPSAVI
jgi:lactate dehydrogenase-like 2-hydroxyacid dehydrogenase